MVKNLNNFTEIDFNEEVKGKKVALKFYADWCGPCNMLRPVFDGVSKENDDIHFVEVSIDENREITSKFGVTSIPTIILLDNQKEVDRKTGFMQKPKLQSYLGELK